MVCMQSPNDYHLYVYPVEDPDEARYETFTSEDAREKRKAVVDKMVDYEWSLYHPAFDPPNVY